MGNTTLISIDPTTDRPCWEGNVSSLAEIDAAIEQAQKAAIDWRRLDLSERLAYLNAYKSFVESRVDELADLITQETGKRRWETVLEAKGVIGKIDISVQSYEERCKPRDLQTGATRSRTRHAPHGVVAVLGPFNFPAHLPNGHIVPALLAGNTVVFKPSHLTPAVGERLVQYWHESGLPDGVLTLVQGGADQGRYLAGHPNINGVYFTGSASVGNALATMAITQPNKILAMEMGGDNPLIVGQIDDIQAAVYMSVVSGFITTGQRCTCARRLIVVDSPVASQFVDALVGGIKKINDEFMGPVISKDSARRCMEFYTQLVERGAMVLQPMTRDDQSAWVRPGVVDVTQLTDRTDDELFGPLIQVIRVPSLDAAIREANATSYGLSAGILSQNEADYDQLYCEGRAGIMNWNQPLTGASSSAPFGGIGKSGNYRPSAYYAADYCAYPVASMEASELRVPESPLPGLQGI